MQNSCKLYVDSEIGGLERVIVHSPDSGLGRVVPSKAQDWLFEDIVHLDTIRKKEYDYFTKILMYFLDPKKIKGKLKEIDSPALNRAFYKPGNPNFHRSEKVIELEVLLSDILQNPSIRERLIAAVCALEGCTYETESILEAYSAEQLATTFLSGTTQEGNLIFAPVPNFIFTRDIGIVIKDYLLLNRPSKKARSRESLLSKYIFFNHPYFQCFRDHTIELSEQKDSIFLPHGKETDKKVTLEGGDIMVISPSHLLIGISERTTEEAASKIAGLVLQKDIMERVSLIRIPKKRDYMHIDTLFTQVRKDVWVMLGIFSEKNKSKESIPTIERYLNLKDPMDSTLEILQFSKDSLNKPVVFHNLESFLRNISLNEFHTKDVTIIYSGNDEFPFSVREQWTDSCNLLALKEGVVLGYDRNDKTTEAFAKADFRIITAEDLIHKMELGEEEASEIKNTLILMPSSELSRARGGFHCMSLPVSRMPI